MRICHFSDSHLGAGESHPKRGASGLTLRQEDVISSFTEAIDKIIAIRPEVCVHSGDLFHAVRPLNSIMAIAGRELHRLAETEGIPTIIITGNHDAPKQPHVGAAIDVYRQIKNLTVVAGSTMQELEIQGTCFHSLPHCSSAETQREELARCRPDPDAHFSVLIMHGVAAGMPEFSMADLGEYELPLDVMKPYDYTALGHFHNYCQVGPRAYYAGSTERLSQAERDSRKGFVTVNLEPFSVTFHEVSTRAMIDAEEVDGSGLRGDQLVRLIQERLDTVDKGKSMVRIKIRGVTPETLKTIPANAINQIKQEAFHVSLLFEKGSKDSREQQFGRSAFGSLDAEFANFLSTAETAELDKARLLRDAERYLRAEE